MGYNDVFSRAAALSPCLWVDPKAMKELIKSHPLREPTRIYMDMGGAETDGSSVPFRAMFELAKSLSAVGADVAARIVPGAQHCEADWEKRIGVFFDYLLN